MGCIMRTSVFAIVTCIATAAALVAGCGKSSDSNQASTPAMPETQKALATATDEAKKTVTEAAGKVVDAAKSTGSDVISQFLSTAKTQGDSVLSSIGQDLAAKAKQLGDSCGANPSVKTNLDSTLTAITAGKDSEALNSAFQTGQGASLTPTQLQLTKEVGNLASAFVVQRNFSSLPNAQGDVATVVNSLRSGEYAAALPPLQKIMSNVSLTPAQKQLLTSVADKYAPSLKQAAGSVQEGLQKLGLPGLKK